MSHIKKNTSTANTTPSSTPQPDKSKIEKQQQAVIKEIERKEKEKRKEEKRKKKEEEKQEKKEKRRSGSFSLSRKKTVVKGKKDGPATGNGERKDKGKDYEKDTEKELVEGERGQESDLIKLLERLKANDKTLTEIDNPSIVREIHLVGKDFIKIVSDCLVFNTHLLRLDLSGCEITLKQAELLAEALKVNSSLQHLNLSWNNLGDAGVAAIAAGLAENEGLKKVDLRNNGLTPKAMHTLATALKGNVSLLHLKLSESAPIFVAGDDLIITDDLDNSNIQRQETSDINALEKILLANREVAKCFTGDSVMAKLSDRGLAKIPPLLLVLPTLVHLDLSHNQLTFIPRAIKALTRLEHLNLSNNLLVGLPREFGALKALKHLDLSNNKLSQLPLTIVLLKNLEVLHVRNNILVNIPTCFGTLPNLREMHLQGNQTLGTMPKQTLASETLPLTHLKDQNKGSVYCYRIKLMCVGQANVGKTSLIDMLSKKTLRPMNSMISQSDLVTFASNFGGGLSDVKSLAKPVVSPKGAGKVRTVSDVIPVNTDLATDGIVIKDWTSKGPSGVRKGELETVNFASWDFAGQEVYYYTHLFFLSHRGIYLLVFNLLKPEEEFSRIEYWLQSIHTRARGAPVILVGTHLDDPKCSKKYLDGLYANLLQKFSGQFKSIRFFFALSCTTGKGVEDLKKKITELAIQMAEKEGKVPIPYFTLEEKLKAVAAVAAQPVISWDSFQEMALSCGIPGPLIPKAAAFLHELGALVHFNEHESGLDDVVVLDSQWLTSVFSDVITLKHNFVKDGVLNKKDLPQIWKAPVYPETVHDSLIALLEKFEVAYSLPQLPGEDGGSEGAGILVPCLLPSTRPSDLTKPGMWPKYEAASDSTQLGRFYSFNFMPFGFFNRFMVRLLRSGWVLQKAWKNGMFFMKGSDKLLLELDNEVAYRLKLYMRGPNPAPAMLVLLASIDTLVADWLKVEVKIEIPCPHCIKDHIKPYLFSQAELEQAVSRGNTVVLCRGVDAVSIYGLAPDLALTETNRPVIPYSDLTLSNELYSSNQHKTFKGTYKGETVLVKQFTEVSKGDKPEDSTTFSTFRSEVWVMSGLRHPNIVELKGFCTSPLCLVMEYMDMGTLYTFIHEKSNAIDWNLRLKIASDVARGMAFLHSITPPIIHRDLTSHSVLLSMENPTSDGSDKPVLTAKISDFGLSRSLLLADNLVGEAGQENPVWLAPEILCKRKYNEKADIYSFGVIIWELLTREDYFGDAKDWKTIETNVVIGQRPPIPDCFIEYQELLNECWHTEPAHRPSAPAIVKRLSRVARKYNFAIPTASSAVLMPSASVRQFFAPTSTYEGLDDDMPEEHEVVVDEGKGKEKVKEEVELPKSPKGKEKTPRYASTIESEFIAGQQRAKITRLEETVQSLHNKLREAVRAKNQAERNLAFQILENDRQKNSLERLKAKVQRMKADIEEKEKDRLLSSQSPKITKSLSRRSWRGRSLPPDEGIAAVEKLAALSTQPLRKKVSEDAEEKEVEKENEAETEVQNGDGLKREASKMDVREIQERLRRRQVSKRILDRLAYFERLQGSAISSSPPSASNLHSLLASEPSTSSKEEVTEKPKEVGAKASAPAGSKTPPATRRSSVGNKSDAPIRRTPRGDEGIPRSITDESINYDREKQSPSQAREIVASLSASSPLLRPTPSRSSGSMPSGINQIFYGKEELIKLLLELDEFD